MIAKFSSLTEVGFFDGPELIHTEPTIGRKRGTLVNTKASPDDSSQSKAVLVLENDAEVRKSLVNYFHDRGFDLLACDRPDEALKLVQQTEQPIGVAVVDMSMPVMWGDLFAGALALISPETKVIFISGHSAEMLRDLGSLTEGDIFFPKPYSPRLLLHKVWELLGMEVPVDTAPKVTVTEILNSLPQDPHFAEHLELHMENDQCVE